MAAQKQPARPPKSPTVRLKRATYQPSVPAVKFANAVSLGKCL